jgi:hypothetical protein
VQVTPGAVQAHLRPEKRETPVPEGVERERRDPRELARTAIVSVYAVIQDLSFQIS